MMRGDRSIGRIPVTRSVPLLALLVVMVSSASAAPIEVSGGYDYYRGPADQITQGPTASVGVGLGLASASLGAMRFDDNHVGAGTSVTAGVGFPVLPLTQLHAYGTRYRSDQDYRAWRVKVGPQIGIPTGQTLGLFYSHYSDNREVDADGATAELASPLVAGLSGRVIAGYAKSGGFDSGQGSVGLSWKVLRHLELSGDVGMAKSGALATQPFPRARVLDLPLIGGGSGAPSTTEEDAGLETTLLLGVRIVMP